MSRKEILSLFAAAGFLVIWFVDLDTPMPGGADAKWGFWEKILFHYSWIMYAAGCLFYYQYAKNERMKKDDSTKKPN